MKKASYKIRFNPAKTVKTINKTLDAIDNAGGYCRNERTYTQCA